MTNYKLYPNLPPEALGPRTAENPQVAYHLSVIRAKMQGLKNKEQMFKQKYEKYTKILNRLTWLNACSSGISVATGISRRGNICYIRRTSSEHGIGCSISNWSDC